MASEAGSRDIAQALIAAGCPVRQGRLGDVAASIEKEDFRLLILDCGLDVRRGFKLLQQVKEATPEVPVLFITEAGSEEAAVKAFRLGARDYFKKPVNLFELKATISNILSMPRSYSQRYHYPLGVFEPPPAQYSKHLPPNILRAVNFLEDRLKEDVSLEAVAAEAGLSRHHFCRLFKKYTGASPMQFLTRLRIEKAKDLFMRTTMNVSMVALEAGFNDLSGFIKNFKRTTGFTPNAFRKKKEAAEKGLQLF